MTNYVRQTRIETLVDRLQRIATGEIPHDPHDAREFSNDLRRIAEHHELRPIRHRLRDRALLIQLDKDREACATEILEMFARLRPYTLRERIQDALP